MLKTPHSGWRTRRKQRQSDGKLPFYWVAFIVQEIAVLTCRREKVSIVLHHAGLCILYYKPERQDVLVDAMVAQFFQGNYLFLIGFKA